MRPVDRTGGPSLHDAKIEDAEVKTRSPRRRMSSGVFTSASSPPVEQTVSVVRPKGSEALKNAREALAKLIEAGKKLEKINTPGPQMTAKANNAKKEAQETLREAQDKFHIAILALQRAGGYSAAQRLVANAADHRAKEDDRKTSGPAIA